MTNAEIIMKESVELMKQGVLKGQLVQLADGQWLEIPEEIHTFAAWKERGFSVKKGEHAVAKFTIWKYRKGKVEEGQEEEEAAKGKCFMKQAFFFKADQVQPIQG